jgi:TRAP-type C4-dicarboxylate transport system substrate-binding protein
MRKTLSILLAIVMIAASLTACGNSGGNSTDNGNTEEKTFNLKIADLWSSSHPVAAAVDNVFKKQVEEKSGGTITVDVYHDGLLGDEAALWQSVRDGSVDMVVVGSYMNQEFPMMLISDWPFLYRDLEHAKKVWTGSIADEVSAKFNERFPEVELLGWAPNSARTFTSNKKLTLWRTSLDKNSVCPTILST